MVPDRVAQDKPWGVGMGGRRLCASPTAQMIGDAVAVKPIRILLEVQVIDESMCGRASTESGATHEFAGWLGLLRALEVLLPDPSRPREAQELDDLSQRADQTNEGSFDA